MDSVAFLQERRGILRSVLRNEVSRTNLWMAGYTGKHFGTVRIQIPDLNPDPDTSKNKNYANVFFNLKK
jgi:hypothetical protein